MNYLQARKILSEFPGGSPLRLLFAASGTAEPLELYLRAAAAERGLAADVRLLPFGTLGQTLSIASPTSEKEVFLLCPWDLVPEGDWRSGVASALDAAESLTRRADEWVARLVQRDASVLYLDAPLAPLWIDEQRNEWLREWLRVRVRGVGAVVLPEACFALDAYLGTGCPIGGRFHGQVAKDAIAACLREPAQTAKVLVTDLDNTLWRGVVGDVGVDGIEYGAQGAGFAHFIYQSFLLRLQSEGVLLAAISKNDDEVARAPLREGKMVLREEAFVAILASWNAKSAQISALATSLNLGLDSFVFVDDNDLELEEVTKALPGVAAVRFPSKVDELPILLDQLASRFRRTIVTAEDRARTEMYRLRLEGLVPVDATGADLKSFLMGLSMRLEISDRSRGDRSRAVQLINKTNQFNLNGRRLSDEDVQVVLDRGGKLIAATLSDRGGSHGEILACLVDGAGTVQALVLSCRVFQRRVEFAFFAWMLRSGVPIRRLNFAATERNGPVQAFLREAQGIRVEGEACVIDEASFLEVHQEDQELFEIVGPMDLAGGAAAHVS